MAWTLGGISLTVENDSEDSIKPRIDFIDPIVSSLTTHAHFAGTEGKRRTLKCVFWETYESEFLPLVDGAAKALVSDQGAEGNYVILSAKSTRLQDLKRSAPVVRVDIELLKV